MSDIDFDVEAVAERAKKSGFKVIHGSPHRLLLDLDGDGALEAYEEKLAMVQQYIEVVELKRWRSRSGRNWHIVLQLYQAYTLLERMVLQAVLGSDLKREWCALLCHWRGFQEPHLLFKPKQKQLEPKHMQTAV